MRLTRFTDNALRCLIVLGLDDADGAGPTPIGEIARRMAMSEDHLIKVVRRLTKLEYLRTTRGRGGGVQLRKKPADINIGTVVRSTEDNLNLVECFDAESNTCPIADACVLSRALGEALTAFLRSLDGITLADLIRPGKRLRNALLPATVA